MNDWNQAHQCNREVKAAVEKWRVEHNTERPHTSLSMKAMDLMLLFPLFDTAKLWQFRTIRNRSHTSRRRLRHTPQLRRTRPDVRLHPGMTASADILVEEHKNTLLLSTEALRPKNEVLRVGGTAAAPVKETKTVALGLRTDATVEVLSGLQVGDSVEVPKVKAADRRKVSFDGPN